MEDMMSPTDLIRHVIELAQAAKRNRIAEAAKHRRLVVKPAVGVA
jgi:hypothetical protein